MPEDAGDEVPSTRPFWSGTITFGLVSIPVSLFAANRSSRVSLHLIGPKGNQLRRRYFSQETGKELQDEEIVRGYEIEKDKYIVVTDEELDRLAPEMSRDIDLRRFVPYSDIPRLYFEHGYFLAPAGASGRAYRLLAETMERTGQAGIATFVMRGKEYLVAIVAEDGLLRAETLRFSDEVRTPADVDLPEVKRPPAGLVRKFEKAIASAASDVLPADEMHNREAGRLNGLAERKASRHKGVVGTPEPETDEEAAGRKSPADLFEALQRALANPAARKREERAEPARTNSGSDLDRLSKHELYERAKELEIRGRSAMSREELVEAIRKAA